MELTSRRAFLQRSSAAAALVTLPGLVSAGCGGGDDDRIARVAIHPELGIGRVGNSPEAMYFGPEVPEALPHAPQGFKDADGAMARQAARFRIYGLDASGRPVRELTAHDADITWRVTVANAKPACYAAAVERVVAGHRADRLAYSALEDRFPDRPFWERRRAQRPPPPAFGTHEQGAAAR